MITKHSIKGRPTGTPLHLQIQNDIIVFNIQGGQLVPYNPNINHRRSIRLKHYDYSLSGAYFVTICTWNRECLFGEIKNRTMHKNEFGEIVSDEWKRTEDLRPYVKLDLSIIMPNHLHGILIINDDNGTKTVGARRCLALNKEINIKMSSRLDVNQKASHRDAPTGVKSGSLGAIIGQFKSIATKKINKIRKSPGYPVWQRNYYERIIRNENELHKIWEYINSNPFQWEIDENNPVNL